MPRRFSLDPFRPAPSGVGDDMLKRVRRASRSLPVSAHHRNRCRWDRGGQEPELGDMLADPVIELVMRRDGLTRDDVEAVMREARRRIDRRVRRASGDALVDAAE